MEMLSTSRKRIHGIWKEFFHDPSLWLDLRDNKLVGGDRTEEWGVAISKTICGIILWLFQYMLESHGFKTYILLDKRSSALPDFRHRISNKSLWIVEMCNPSWIYEELKRRKQTFDGELRIPDIINARGREDFSFVSLLKACARKQDLYEGTKLHAAIQKKGLLERELVEKNPYLASALVNMYAKCGMLSKAQEMHEDLPIRSIDSWNAMIGGYAYNEEGYKALDCFERMQKEGFLPNVITFLCILRVCGSTKAVDKGKQIHEEISTRGLLNQNSVVLGTALVDMYAKCGELVRAQELHDKLHVRDVVSWSALISGYANQGKSDEALICFERMQDEGIFPNSVTFICILKACGSKGAIEKGKQIHDEIVNMNLLEKDVVLGTALVDMYVKCGALARAQQILKELCVRDAVSWNALITGYVQKEQYYEALDCFDEMQSEGISPDLVTLTCIMKAAGSIGAIEKGNQIHGEIMRWGLLEKNAMIGNAVVDMYVKCGMLGKAQEVLEGLSVRDVISWSAIIAGHAQQGQGHEALNCFELMRSEGISPNVVTFICVLKACGSKGTIAKGEEIHDEITKKDLLRKDIVLGNALVDMYVKCGALSRAYQVLEELPIRDVVSWSSLIAGHAKKRQGYEALECFQCMKGDGLSPDGVTFLCLLSACSQSGLLDEAQMCFGYMNKEIGITVGLEHHMHLVLVLGCAGYFDKAMSVIKTMPSSDYAPFWIAILDACKKLGNASFGRLAFDHAVQLNDACSPGNVLLSTLYPAASDERMSTLAVFGDGYS